MVSSFLFLIKGFDLSFLGIRPFLLVGTLTWKVKFFDMKFVSNWSLNTGVEKKTVLCPALLICDLQL